MLIISLQGIPILVGTAVVAVTAVLAKMFLFGNKKKKAPVALQDPTVKYPLKLIDREVSTGCGVGRGVVYSEEEIRCVFDDN